MSKQESARQRQLAGEGRELSRAGASVSHGHPSKGLVLSQDHAERVDRPAHGRVVAHVWLKTVRQSAHQLRVPRAWALDAVDLHAVKRAGVRYISLRDLDELHDYWVTLPTILAKGFRIDRGHGQQIALTLEWWRPTRAKAAKLARELAESEPPALQAELWKGGAR